MASSNSAKPNYYFDNVIVDHENFCVLKNGEKKSLTPKAFDLLIFLLEQGGRVVEKQEIFERVWRETFVTDNALTRVVKEIRRAVGDDAAQPRYIETIPKRGYRFAAKTDSGEMDRIEPIKPKIPVIAVLPFKSLAPNAADEYLGLGLADALITLLSNTRNFIVRPTSSILRYASGDNQNSYEIGRELRVQAILEGSVRKSGEKLRVTVQFVNIENNQSLWAERFDEKFSDIFTVEDTIAEKIAQSLALHLNIEERNLLTKRYTDHAEAHELYLKGRFYANKFTLENFHKAIESFNRALEFDPEYALAYAGIAEANWIAADIYLNPLEAIQTTKETAGKAIELDRDLAEAHTFLATALMSLDWNWTEVERYLRRAIELNPNFAPAHQWFGWLLSILSRHDEAIVESETAKRLDPFSIGVNWFLIVSYSFAGNFETALEKSLDLIEIEPNFWGGHWSLGYCYSRIGKFPESLKAYKKAAALDDSPMIKAAISEVYALSGNRERARKLLDELLKLEKTQFVPPYYLAMIYASFNELDNAFAYLERAFELRDSSLTAIKVDQRFINLRSDERFKTLLERIGLT